MEFTTTHLQFVKSTTNFLARTMINNFNQPFKIYSEKNNRSRQNSIKFPTFLGDPKYFYPEISSQLKYKFVLRKNPTKHCARNIKNIRFSKSINNIL